MPLDVGALKTGILTVIDSGDPAFVGFPLVLDVAGAVDLDATLATVGANWAGAARPYFAAAVIPSAVLPIAHGLASAAMAARVAAVLKVTPLAGLLAISGGFDAYAASLAGSVVPGAGVITPPPPLVFPALPVGPADAAAQAIAQAVDTWARTGLFLATGAPSPVPWS